ncbi:MAG: dTDP-glucose 4,6-dehydratase [Thermacetogenium sp.]|nr:dTDP-glucose 4,6-dehydratase [Thermacetogenium sp.]
MKLLVTGGAGFIGSNFIRHILREHPEWQVVNLDKLTYAGNLANLRDVEGNPRYRFVRGDIADRKLVEKLFQEEKFDVVVNFAAESHVDRSILDSSPFIETNVKGVQVLLEAARKFKIKKFVQISTDEVYGSLGPDDPPFTEESPLLPNSPYSASKAAADLLCRAYYKAYGMPVIITRSSNNYGPYQFPEKLIPLMIRNALHGKPLPVYGKGENVRDWLFAEDNCRAIGLVLQKGRVGEVYNIGGGCEKRNIDVVELICDVLAEKLNGSGEFKKLITFIKDPRGAAHDFRYALDCTKIKEELGWKPQLSFEEGLKKTVSWYLQHQDWVESVVTGEYQEYYNKVYGT